MSPLNAVPIHAANPGPITGDGNWTWLIRGRVTTLVDAGTGEREHVEGVARALDGDALQQVLVTHGHTDHASGAAALAERFPSARFLKMPWAGRDGKWSVAWEAVADGQAIAAGDTTLHAVHTPGHSPDHLCFWHDETKTLFGGDLAIADATVFIPASHGGDLAAYLESLARVLALRPSRLLPAHGAVIDDPDALLREYLEHRRVREQQVLGALRAGDDTPAAMVARIYVGIEEARVALARESVEANLLKLEREGRVRRAGEAWHIIDP